ncbi:flagellar basal-body MS-ring/collar protein FliF [Sideroxydans lithotrophicus]|uniref:Flagellar M-ring protein n=1 Tax=Sideroxydans lithotrophicus (strain ES-1) TaxID=580332 RepID=D5CN02_SIDLE|nr:flagellar basal-body MS-ring/collar protein FliF [Sideroxydans lithotrophicus]ADE10838.1 flagellar M-ring protein FliF [Sideroxydans lithotrophicus ES-1]
MADTDANMNVSLTRLLFGMPSQQKLGLIVAVAATVALLAGLFMWGQTPDYRVLYANMSERDGGAVIESLQQQNIPYKFTEGGTLMVPADRVYEVRLQMAAKGLPKGGTVGFELMENQKFGTSQFLEQVNYQRALEGELSRSVETIASVASARVHLAIPKQSVFVKEQQKPSASVILSLRAGNSLDEGQVSAIVHLISSSVPNMNAQNVTVVDQSGTLLSSARDSNAEQLMDATQLKYVRQIEQDYVKRIEDILIPITGVQNVRAQVTASLDFSQTEQTAETFRPNQPPNQAAVRSLQTLETQNGTTSTGGVPGALSNQPPVPATAPIVTPASAVVAAAGTAGNMHKELTTNYEVDRTIQHTKLPVGSIKRLSIAVVVNNPSTTGKDGKATSRPYTDAEKAQITALVKETVGFDAKRGDSLNLLNSAFNEQQEIIAETPMWKQPDTIAMAKDIFKYLLIAGGIGFLLFGIIKPAFKTISEQSAAQETAMMSAAQHGQISHQAGNAAGQYAAQQSASSYEDNLQLAKQLAKDDPKIVATVVKEWVNKE